MTDRTLMRLRALDTWWFREGRLFEQTDEGLAEAESVFPPSPATLAGAVAVALARALPGRSVDPVGTDWSADGSGLDELTGLAGRGESGIRATGPFILRGHELFVPMPLTLALDDEHNTRILLPTAEMGSDLGRALLVRKQPLTNEDPKALERFETRPKCWLRWPEFVRHALDMQSSQGKFPGNAWFNTSSTFASEGRIGIGADPVAGVAKDGQLYAASHIRPQGEDWLETGQFFLAVQLERRNDRLPSNIATPLTLGGKGRLATAEIVEGTAFAPGAQEIQFDRWDFDPRHKQCLRLRLIAVTPVPIDERQPFGLPAMTKELAGLEPVAAALGRPQTIGLWRGNDAPRLVRVFPAGSTWFARLAPQKMKKAELIKHLWREAFRQRLASPDLAAQGFGAFVIGNWPKPNQVGNG